MTTLLQYAVVALCIIVASCSRPSAAVTTKCRLVIKGWGPSQMGVRQFKMDCSVSAAGSSADGAAAPRLVEVGVNTTYLSPELNMGAFSGVKFANACVETVPVAFDYLETADEGGDVNVPRVRVFPMLCFYGDLDIVFEELFIEDVWLDYDQATNGFTTALLVGWRTV